jgi:L-arabinose isomerase
VERRLEALGADVVSAGLVDTAPAAHAAGELLAQSGVDLLVCYVGTYATSSQVLPVVQHCGKRVLVLNLQPSSALDYANTDTGEWLANCSVCCVPEISNAFARARIPFQVVSGTLAGDKPWREIAEWVDAARAAAALRRARIGFLGHTYPGMLDLYSDFTMVQAQTGAHVEVLEMCDLEKRLPEQGEAPAIERLVADFDLQGLSYYYRGLDENPYERLGAGLILGNSLLTARGVPASGEGDLKTCLAMFLLDRLDAGGSFTEFCAMDFDEGFVLMGHDGPGHIAISDEKPVLRGLGLYHGKRGYGVSVEFKVKVGPVTILAMTQTAEGRLKMLAAEGESLPGPILRVGNTNSRLRFSLPPDEFVNAWCAEGPTHHCALGVGHVAGRLGKVSRLCEVPLVEVG